MHRHEKRRIARRYGWAILLVFALFALILSLVLLLARIASGPDAGGPGRFDLIAGPGPRPEPQSRRLSGSAGTVAGSAPFSRDALRSRRRAASRSPSPIIDQAHVRVVAVPTRTSDYRASVARPAQP